MAVRVVGGIFIAVRVVGGIFVAVMVVGWDICGSEGCELGYLWQ